LVCMLLVARAVHGRVAGLWGWVVGLAGGFAVFFVGMLALGFLGDVAFRGVPIRPRCRNGRCGAADYQMETVDGHLMMVCKCGDRYRRRGRRFMIVNPDGSEAPFMVWRPFRGWFEDREHTARVGD